MGLIMMFYAADPEVFVTLRKRLASAQISEDEIHLIYKHLDSYQHADFSLNFTIPEHTDALCQAMIAEGLAVPPSSLDLFGKPLWYDDAASIHQLPHAFPLALTQVNESCIKRIAEQWVTSFLPAKGDTTDAAIAHQNVLKALSDLRIASSFALEHHQSLLLCFAW